MSHEQPAKRIRPAEQFGFSPGERLYHRVSDKRVSEFLEDEATTIHDLSESSNNYGEFLFVLVSRPGHGGQIAMTFWGLGYHEWRGRWFHDEWFWYDASPADERFKRIVSKTDTMKQLAERRGMVELHVHESDADRSRSTHFFEMLSDLADDDDARMTLDEMGEFFLDDPS